MIRSKLTLAREIAYDAFGHVRIDEINPGKWFSKIFKKKLSADKVLVQKSGYFARSSKPNKEDLELIENSAILAVDSAIQNKNGVVGITEDSQKMELIDFKDIRGGKPFDHKSDWFIKLLNDINQIDS